MNAAEVAWWETTLGMGIQPQKKKLSWQLSALVHQGSLRRGRQRPKCCYAPGKHAAGIAPHQAGCCAGMGCPRGSTSMCAQKTQGPFGPSERSRKPHDGPQGPFFQLLLSRPLRHLIQPALSARASAGPRPAPSLTVTVPSLGQGTVLASSVVSPRGSSSVPGGCSRALGGTFGRTLPGTGASSHFSAGICRACAAGSALTTHRGQVCSGLEGSHSICTMHTS